LLQTTSHQCANKRAFNLSSIIQDPEDGKFNQEFNGRWTHRKKNDPKKSQFSRAGWRVFPALLNAWAP